MSTPDPQDNAAAVKGKTSRIGEPRDGPSNSGADKGNNSAQKTSHDDPGGHNADKSKEPEVVQKPQCSSGSPGALEGVLKLDAAATEGFLERVMDADGVYIIVNSTSPAAQDAQRRGGKKRFFGIPKGSAPANVNPDDYEAKYPEDAFEEETGPSARVWRTYLDEAQKADAELVESWRDTTDVLLVFAGLFSAVVATFVTQSSNSLDVDYAQVTATLLIETNSLLRAMANQSSSGSIPSSALNPASNFSSSASDRWINGLWFASLTVSLIAAFMAVLVKQWIQHYQSIVFGTPREQARIRHFRFFGVEHWQMPLIIGFLPMLLHIALFLYFVGLVVFLIPLEWKLAISAAVIGGLAYILYILSALLPLRYPMCPYQTPLSSAFAWLSLSLRALVSLLIARFYATLAPMWRSKYTPKKAPSKGHSGVLHLLRDAEKKAVEEIADEIDARAFKWLYETSSNPAVMSVTLQALSGLKFGFKASARDILKQTFTFQENSAEYQYAKPFFALNDRPCSQLEDEVVTKLERLHRAFYQLEMKPPHAFHRPIPREDRSKPRSRVHEIYLRSFRPMKDYPAFYKHQIKLLESYAYGDEGSQPVMWLASLKKILDHTFHTPSECWSHAFKTLINFAPDRLTRRLHHDLRFPMMLEYICSLSIRTHGKRQQVAPGGGWGDHSVINGAPFCYAKVAPKIYAVLSVAICALQDENFLPSGSAEGLSDLLDGLLFYLVEAMKADANLVYTEQIDRILCRCVWMHRGVERYILRYMQPAARYPLHGPQDATGK